VDTAPETALRHHRARLNGVHLHWVEAGPTAGKAVILLHGFPEFWYSWRHQIPALAAAGFRAVALDMRGYGDSSKPPRVSDYRIETLVADVAAVIDHFGGRAHLVGHDWGGIVAWYAWMWVGDRLDRLVVLNAPHPAAYLREVRKPRQALRSYYAFLFQLPWLPEAVIAADDFRLLRRLFREGPIRPFSDGEIDAYVRAFSGRGGLTGPINYYRAALRGGPTALERRVKPIDVPTLLLWGLRDRYLVPELTDGLEPQVRDLRVERHAAATHWLQHDEPDWVSERIIGFLRGSAPPR
jgi:pimeloyl-ACP methyl ester carboxylesterase